MNTMSTSTLVALIAVVIVVVVAIALIIRTERSKRLKTRFGPEYQRAVTETGSATQAESRLEKLEKRVEGFKIRQLSQADRANFLAAWQKIQARFVDDPRAAVIEADKLIQALMAARGYPVTDFEQRAADIPWIIPSSLNIIGPVTTFPSAIPKDPQALKTSGRP